MRINDSDLRTIALQLADQKMPEGWSSVGSSGSARVAFHAGRDIYYKEFLPRSPWEKLKALVRGSRATRARKNSDNLLREGFNAPANVAWGTLPNNREYLFASAVPGHGITHWLRVKLDRRDSESLRVRRKLLRQLGDFIGQVHAAGFIHGDLRPSNALAELDGENFSFSLIDNERNRQSLPPAGKGMLKNLMQLNMLRSPELTRSDRWRFYKAWRPHHPDISDLEARLLATEAYHWAMRRLDAKDKL